jgi:hypothetical protein
MVDCQGKSTLRSIRHTAMDQVPGRVIAVVGGLAQRQDFPDHPVVAVVLEFVGVAVGVGELDQVASGVIKRLGRVAKAVGKLGQQRRAVSRSKPPFRTGQQ